MSDTGVDLSIVTAAYNEAPNLEPLYEQITAAVARLGLRYEIIVVDDGSNDDSFAVLRELHRRDPEHLRVVRLRRNFGQTAAWVAGFDHVRGEIVVVMDADLQNDPADIPTLLAKIDEGYELVNGWRQNRHDRFLDRKLPSMAGNWLVSTVTGVRLHDYGCSLRAFRADILRHLRLYGEMHRYMPALASWIGVRMTEVSVSHRSRVAGRSKYGLGRAWRVLLDLVTIYFLLGFSSSPMRLFGGLGLVTSLVGLGMGLYLAAYKIIVGLQRGSLRAVQIGNRPLLLLAVLLIMIGVQLVMMGLLGELVVRTYHESQGKTIYVVRETLDSVKSEPERSYIS
jgi:glycosyltransferase involved in cell wall biosynthesis